MNKAIRKIFSFWVIFPVLAVAGIVVFTLVLPVRLILTGSMSPTMPAGTLIMNMHVEHVSPGQVITFHEEPGGDLVTHRVYGVDANGDIETKGDANPTPDLHTVPLRMSDVVGVVVGGRGVPLVTVICLVVVVLLGLTLLNMVQRYRSLNSKDAHDATELENVAGADLNDGADATSAQRVEHRVVK